MFKNTATALKIQQSHTKILAASLPVLVLLLVYGAGIITLPLLILKNYQGRNCSAVLSLSRTYKSAYPAFIEDKTLSGPVSECETYTLAALADEKGIWRDAYDAFQVYLTAYPTGLFAEEAHEHSAIALVNMAKDQVEQKKYDEALANLNLVISGYPATAASPDAWTLVPTVYVAWGTGLREAGDCEGSERVFNDFKTWAQINQKPDLEGELQRQFVQTYLAWGHDFQSQKQYENALAKFDMAISADPQSQFDSLAQAKAGKRSVYIEWGNDLLEQYQPSIAVEKFELAVSLAQGDNDSGARDALANGHIRWARDLSTDEDFKGALEHLGFAKEAAVSDAMKKSVDTALQDTYLAFSNSTGPQARVAMKEALNSVCQKHRKPGLQIFGLNKDLVHIGIYGADAQLPENLVARTPGEMHYIACVKEENQTVDSRYHRVILLQTSRGYYYTSIQQFRVQLFWTISLLQTDTIKGVAEETFKGGPPPPFPESADNSARFFYGPPPSMEELSEWLRSVMQ